MASIPFPLVPNRVPFPARRVDLLKLQGTQPPRGALFARASPARHLAPSGRVTDVTMCALVLEDVPASTDARLVFESFPETLEQSYRLEGYRKIGGNRMSQPAFATYQGGDWGPFPLTLKFRAGERTAVDVSTLGPAALEQVLIEMEHKVNWTEAICFPLERDNLEAERILARALATLPPGAIATTARDKIKRNDPPFVLIVIGAFRVIRGYCTDWKVTWEAPFHPVSARPYGATVSMTFNPIMPEYPTFQTIRKQAGKTGFTTATPTTSVSARSGQTLSDAQLQRSARERRLADNSAALSAGVSAGVSANGNRTVPNAVSK